MHTSSVSQGEPALTSLLFRGLIGGLLMGLANLVPGISGGTMLLAVGVYPLFIGAIAELSTFRFRLVSLVTLGAVVIAAAVAILLVAGPVKVLVVDHRWVMYSLFIGLTLGGLPVVWKIARPATRATWVGAGFGFVAMSILAIFQQAGASHADSGSSGALMLFIAGTVGAAAMILPGVSGGYLLLVMGQYVPILSAIDRFKNALKVQDWAAVFDVGLHVLTPVGLGVVLGIVAVSNLLKYLLQRYEKATLGVLLGLLLGAVVGLWPFQEGVKPQVGDRIKGQLVTEQTLEKISPDDYPTRYFRPAAKHIGGALGLIVLGYLITVSLSRLDAAKQASASASS